MNIDPVKRSEQVKNMAASLGFQYCGISNAEFLKDEAPGFEQWLKKGLQGEMSYMERNFDKRLDPTLLVPDAKSIISVLYNYFPEKNQNISAPKVSRYAYGEDYHYVIKDKLSEFFNLLTEKYGEINGRVFVDSAPVMDKVWAKKSGLGWQGKNTNLINPKSGSYFFIAEIICDLKLWPDGPIKDYCGTCTKCLDACPTNALFEPYKIDASRCISYLTIELKNEIPVEMNNTWQDWIFGCDICQEVCPWNRFSKPNKEIRFTPKEFILNAGIKEWFEMTEEAFQTILSNSALHRTKLKGIHRNLKFIHGQQNGKLL